MTGALEASLRRGAQDILGRPLSDEQVAKLTNYVELLVKWQKVQRLVGSSDPGSIIDDLVLDSLLFARVVPSTAERVMDLGSGAGLPGIPLKIVSPSLQITLVEARQKRASFLSAVVRELGLRGARVVNARAEDLPAEYAGAFDAVVMRCAGRLDAVIPLAARFVTPGGSIIAAGPPAAEPLTAGAWTNVERPGRVGARLFAVFTP